MPTSLPDDPTVPGPGPSNAGAGPVFVILAGGRAKRYGGCKPLAPVGVNGEAVIDLVASDAVAAGFATIVLVIGTSTGPAIRYHVAHRWPGSVDVRFALQDTPRGTVDAVLAAGDHLPRGDAFGVGNADDLYGTPALALLASFLRSAGTGSSAGSTGNALVGFSLRNAVIGDGPVTRGLCEVDADGWLTTVTERRQVVALDGDTFVAGDGLEPAKLDGDALVSMNLWGFGPDMRTAFEEAMDRAAHASEDAEVLLPDIVATQLARQHDGTGGSRFRVLPASGRCIGVTHPGDLTLVQADIARQVGSGQRPATPWAGVG
jgi:hypothetical protein